MESESVFLLYVWCSNHCDPVGARQISLHLDGRWYLFFTLFDDFSYDLLEIVGPFLSNIARFWIRMMTSPVSSFTLTLVCTRSVRRLNHEKACLMETIR